MLARQPCDPIPAARDLGQWFCVPPFRVVCHFSVRNLVPPPRDAIHVPGEARSQPTENTPPSDAELITV